MKKRNKFFAPMNIQAIPKPARRDIRVEKTGIEVDGDGSIVRGRYYGWDPAEGGAGRLVEAADLRLNVRNAFVPFRGHVWISVDFSGQELRIPANLSQDPVMVNAFLSGADYHKKVAVEMWGEAAYNQTKRKIAKGLNFSSLYGGTKWSISQNAGIPVHEAQEYLDAWWNVHAVLRRWTKAISAQARRAGVLYSAFGRPRRVKYWYASPDWHQVRFADRTAVNTSVQGAAADMMRIALIRIYNHILFDPVYKGRVILLSTIHDEINFSIDYTLIKEVLPKILKLMRIELPGWKVPMELSVEMGPSWGDMLAFELEGGDWVPVFKKE